MTKRIDKVKADIEKGINMMMDSNPEHLEALIGAFDESRLFVRDRIKLSPIFWTMRSTRTGRIAIVDKNIPPPYPELLSRWEYVEWDNGEKSWVPRSHITRDVKTILKFNDIVKEP